MSLLTGKSGSGKGKLQAVAGASSVKKKESISGGLINVNKLKELQAKKNNRTDNYKLNQNGLSRFRLVKPLGQDDIPLATADQHFIPYIKEDGKEGKRMVYCYKQFGFSDCPVCALHDLLKNARDQALVADADTLGASSRWAAYVVNRDYMAGSEDPIEDHDPRQDKIMLYGGIPPRIADDIIKHLTMKVWGDASDPESGYDFECEGSQTSGKMFNGYKVTEYALSPIPKDFSPAYDVALTRGLKPLSDVIHYIPAGEFNKLFEITLVAIASSGEEGDEIIAEFRPLYDDMLREITAGPNIEEAEQEEESEQEAIEVRSEREENPDIDELPEGEDEDAEGEDVELGENSEDNGEASDGEGGEEDDGSGEGSGEAEQADEEAGDIEEAEQEVEERPKRGRPAKAAPAAKPAPTAKAAKPAPSTAKDTAPKVGGSSLLGKLRTIGKK